MRILPAIGTRRLTPSSVISAARLENG